MSRRRKGRIREENTFKEVEVEKLTYQTQDHRRTGTTAHQVSVLKQEEKTRQKKNQPECCSRGKAKLSPERERVDTWSSLKSGAALRQRLDLELEGRQGRSCWNQVINHFMGPPSASWTSTLYFPHMWRTNNLSPQNNINLAFCNALPLTFRCQRRIIFCEYTLLAGLRVNSLVITIFSILSYISWNISKVKNKRQKWKKKKDLVHWFG